MLQFSSDRTHDPLHGDISSTAYHVTAELKADSERNHCEIRSQCVNAPIRNLARVGILVELTPYGREIMKL